MKIGDHCMTTKVIKTDLEIAQETKMKPIKDIIEPLNVQEHEWEPYGHYKAKLSLELFDRLDQEKDGKVILVTSINPTSAGEGKSTVTIGLGQALNKIGQNAIVALREPSLGPNMGIKGGAAGGGYAQVMPMEEINLHFNGDFHAITTAHNTVAAILDNHLHQGNELNIDTRNIVWKRVLDLNDRALRHIVIGLGGKNQGVPREDGFDITVASEIMAILCLATSVEDLRKRLGEMVVAYNMDGEPVTVKDLQIEGVLTLLLKDAIKPNVVQTLEHTPALIHGGPFANIAHGCNSIIATKMAAKLADYVVTEAGFGADLGAEKFLDIKMREANMQPAAVVVVATIRALKMHGGIAKDQLKEENVAALEAGLSNLKKHLETIESFGVPYVVAINKFITDTPAEIDFLENWCKKHRAPVALTDVWGTGGEGGKELAEKVMSVIESEENLYAPLYELDASLEEKMNTIAKKVYGAEGVVFSKKAEQQLAEFKKFGWDHLAVCMAKTQYSLTDDPSLIGRPEGFSITVRELRPSVGAGFIVALTGNVLTMPGLPKKPNALKMNITEDGKAIGIF